MRSSDDSVLNLVCTLADFVNKLAFSLSETWLFMDFFFYQHSRTTSQPALIEQSLFGFLPMPPRMAKEYPEPAVHKHLLALAHANSPDWKVECPFCDKKLISLSCKGGLWQRFSQSLNSHAWDCEQKYHVPALLPFDEGEVVERKSKKKRKKPSSSAPRASTEAEPHTPPEPEDEIDHVFNVIEDYEHITTLGYIINAASNRMMMLVEREVHALKKHSKSDEYFELSLEIESDNFYVLNVIVELI